MGLKILGHFLEKVQRASSDGQQLKVWPNSSAHCSAPFLGNSQFFVLGLELGLACCRLKHCGSKKNWEGCTIEIIEIWNLVCSVWSGKICFIWKRCFHYISSVAFEFWLLWISNGTGHARRWSWPVLTTHLPLVANLTKIGVVSHTPLFPEVFSGVHYYNHYWYI